MRAALQQHQLAVQQPRPLVLQEVLPLLLGLTLRLAPRLAPALLDLPPARVPLVPLVPVRYKASFFFIHQTRDER